MDVDALAHRARAGDLAARERLFTLVRPGLDGLARRWSHRPEDAAEGVQQGFTQAIARFSSWDPQRPFLPWLTRIVHNACMDLGRRSRREVSLPEDEAADPLGDEGAAVRAADEGLDAARMEQRVRTALDALPPLYREALVLYHWDGLSCRDIAQRLSISEGTVMNRLFRARQKMLVLLGPGARP